MNNSAGTAASLDADWIVPDWPAPANVRALITTRAGGVSRGPWGTLDGGGGMNVGAGSGDDRALVQANRDRLTARLPQAPRWLDLVHGADVVSADDGGSSARADAATAITAGVVCAVTMADCLPVLLTDAGGRIVAAAHAGWRGLAAGVLQNTVEAMRDRLTACGLGKAAAAAVPILAYVGPAIGPRHFEVGREVLAAMRERLPDAERAFVRRMDAEAASAASVKYLADLPALAKQALRQAGVDRVHLSGLCTASTPARFYSFRRDRVTGRHAALIWLSGPAN